MAKAKLTDNGNVRVTMTPMQWDVIMSILNHTRLGSDNEARQAISELLVDLDAFNNDLGVGVVDSDISVNIGVEKKDGSLKILEKDWSIEVDYHGYFELDVEDWEA